jgi:hypothetical protein
MIAQPITEESHKLDLTPPFYYIEKLDSMLRCIRGKRKQKYKYYSIQYFLTLTLPI